MCQRAQQAITQRLRVSQPVGVAALSRRGSTRHAWRGRRRALRFSGCAPPWRPAGGHGSYRSREASILSPRTSAGRHGVEDRLHDDGGLALRHHEASGQLFDQDRLDHPKPPKEGASAVARRSVDSGFPTPTQCPRPGRRQCHACRAPGQPPAVSALPRAARQVAFRPTTTPHRSNRRRILRHSTRAPARGVRAANDPVGWPPRGSIPLARRPRRRPSGNCFVIFVRRVRVLLAHA